ncbi:MAG TPA: hypothetical protein VFU97_21495 [Xanthobacteraceae bacterium]|nr:hypothetical protein [Xanthobacteraceae bacterium]
MSRLAKIAIVLVVAALVIAAGKGPPVDAPNAAAPAAAALSILPGDMMRYAGPLPETQVGSAY